MLTKTLLVLSLLTGTVACSNHSQVEQQNIIKPVSSQTVTRLSNTDIKKIASSITVRVNVEGNNRSGILIAKEDSTYTVITNASVTDRGEDYTIQTPDGVKHKATLTNSTEQNDLAVLEFNSSNSYTVAAIGNSDTSQGETVIAAGYSEDKNEILVTEGKISLFTQKPLNKGYSIGFTNETVQGMSGGALLNTKGEVIGILGKGKGAILDTAYDYSDGTSPTTSQRARYKELSFSIPIAYINNLSPQLSELFTIKAEKTEYTGIVKTIDDIAEQITVRIDNLDRDVNGSGVIVAKQGNTYYGLTAKHVLCTLPSVIKPKCEPNGKHQIVTPDGVTHQLNYQNVEANGAWLDIAIFSFESDNDYSVATIGAYKPDGDWIFVSGFPKRNVGQDGKPDRLITGGRLIEEEYKELSVKDTGSLTQSKTQGQNGLVYVNLSYPGMSGGAVLDSKGRLIGINTGAENELYFDEGGNYDEYSLGYSLGEDITDFVSYIQANQTKLKKAWLNVSQNRPQDLSDNEIESLSIQLLIFDQPKNDTNLAAWMNYGNQRWRVAQHEEAISAFEKALNIDPQFDKAYYATGVAHWFKGNYNQAVASLEQAIQLNPNPYFYWRYLAQSHHDLKQYDKAISAYNKAIENQQGRSMNDFVLYLGRGNVLFDSKKYSDAIISYSEAIKINPRHIWAYLNRGASYSELEQYKQALNDYTKAIQINPQYAKAYNNRANTYNKLKKYSKAIADHNKAIKLDPQDAIAYGNRGSIYDYLGQYEQALADYSKAVELNPQDAEVYFNRGRIYHNLKRYEEALSDYTKAIKINPNLAVAYNNRAIAYSNSEQYQQAIADYTKLIKINPNDADAYYNRGLTYGKIEKYEQAISDYTKAIEIDPNLAVAYYYRGITYGSSNQYEQALSDFTQAIEIDPNDVDAYYNRGLTYDKIEEYEQAISDYTKAIEIDSSYAKAYYNRGY